MEKEKKKKILVAVVAVLLVLIVIGGITYAWLRIGLTSQTTNKIKAGMLDLRIDESPTLTENIVMQREIPKSYQQGIQNPPYRFTVQNYSGMVTDYSISLVSNYTGNDEQATKIPDNYIRYILVKNDEEMLASNSKLLSTGRTIDSETIQGGTQANPAQISYALYIWIDSRAGDGTNGSDIMNMIFNAKITITAEQHHTAATPVQSGPNFGTGTTFRPTYFAFGYYDHDNYPAFPTTTEIPSGTRSFVGKDAQGNKGVCINIDGAIHCFQSHNYEYESEHVQQVFGNSQTLEYVNCGHDTDYDYGYWRCEAYDLYCDIYDNGMVLCDDTYQDDDNYDGGDYGGECWVDKDSHVGCQAH